MSPRCYSCGSPILWARSESGGRPIPLEPEPIEGGNVMLVDRQARVLTELELLAHRGAPLYLPHLARCPYARKPS